MARKYSKTEWLIAGAIGVLVVSWYAYETYRMGTAEYQRDLDKRAYAEMAKDSERHKLDEQRAKLAQDIDRLMRESLQRCADNRNTDVINVGSDLARVKYKQCLQEHQRQFRVN